LMGGREATKRACWVAESGVVSMYRIYVSRFCCSLS
jgi:hypothetical protein